MPQLIELRHEAEEIRTQFENKGFTKEQRDELLKSIVDKENIIKSRMVELWTKGYNLN